MTTGYEVKMYHDIGSIAQSLNRIANCLEAGEKRAREYEATKHSCNSEGCPGVPVVQVNGHWWCEQHIDGAFAIITSIKAIFDGQEEA
jgi:hypothetical protein